jgi:hypothetical protein
MKTERIVAIFMLFLPLFCGSNICDADDFDSVRCGSDVRKALLGSTMTNEKVSVIEERHKDLGLKDLGGTEISDCLFLISWRICGEEYALLEAQGVVRDVLKFPKQFEGRTPIYGFVSIKEPQFPGHSDRCA